MMLLLLTKLIAIFIIILGLVYLVSAQATRAMLNYWGQGKRFYIAGVLRIIFGAVLVFAATTAQITVVVIAIGILFIIFGILIFIPPYTRPRSAIQWFQDRTDATLRLLALPLLAIGMLLFFAI